MVRGFVKIAECSEAVGKVINIGSGKEISVGNMALTILDLVGKDLPIVSDSERVRPENSEVERLCANNRQAKDILSWRPECSLRNGLAETIGWIEKNIGRYRPSLYTI